MDWLDSLAQEGRYDSSGTFRLDSRTASEKLARFLVTERDRYLLHLVCATSALDCSRLSLRNTLTTLSAHLEGPTVELVDLIGQALRPDPRRFLALAVLGGLPDHPKVVVESGSERLTVLAGQIGQPRAERMAHPVPGIRLTYQRSLSKLWLAGSRQRKQLERCRHALLAILYDGKPVNQPSVLESGPRSRVYRGACPLGPVEHPDALPTGEAFSCAFTLFAPRPVAEVVVHGVSHPLPDNPWFRPRLLVFCNSLQQDLTGQRLRMDDQLRAILTRVQEYMLEAALPLAQERHGAAMEAIRSSKNAYLKSGRPAFLGDSCEVRDHRGHPRPLRDLMGKRAVLVHRGGDFPNADYHGQPVYDEESLAGLSIERIPLHLLPGVGWLKGGNRPTLPARNYALMIGLRHGYIRGVGGLTLEPQAPVHPIHFRDGLQPVACEALTLPAGLHVVCDQVADPLEFRALWVPVYRAMQTRPLSPEQRRYHTFCLLDYLLGNPGAGGLEEGAVRALLEDPRVLEGRTVASMKESWNPPASLTAHELEILERYRRECSSTTTT